MSEQPEELIRAALKDGCRAHCDSLIDELRRLYELKQELLEALKDAARCVQDDYCPDKCGYDWDDIIARAELK
jgi:hypothetical protein